MQWVEPTITSKKHIGEQVRILTGPFVGEIGTIVGTICWGANRHALVEIGTLEARYGCGPGVCLQVHERRFTELGSITQLAE